MKITVLSPEESLKAWEEMKAENRTLTREQVQEWAMRLPKNMQGNTDYIISQEDWNRFYEWILTDEGFEQWQIDLDIVEYIRNWAMKNVYIN